MVLHQALFVVVYPVFTIVNWFPASSDGYLFVSKHFQYMDLNIFNGFQFLVILLLIKAQIINFFFLPVLVSIYTDTQYKYNTSSPTTSINVLLTLSIFLNFLFLYLLSPRF